MSSSLIKVHLESSFWRLLGVLSISVIPLLMDDRYHTWHSCFYLGPGADFMIGQVHLRAPWWGKAHDYQHHIGVFVRCALA